MINYHMKSTTDNNTIHINDFKRNQFQTLKTIHRRIFVSEAGRFLLNGKPCPSRDFFYLESPITGNFLPTSNICNLKRVGIV